MFGLFYSYTGRCNTDNEYTCLEKHTSRDHIFLDKVFDDGTTNDKLNQLNTGNTGKHSAIFPCSLHACCLCQCCMVAAQVYQMISFIPLLCTATQTL